jgi:hypothetical protein
LAETTTPTPQIDSLNCLSSFALKFFPVRYDVRAVCMCCACAWRGVMCMCCACVQCVRVCAVWCVCAVLCV